MKVAGIIILVFGGLSLLGSLGSGISISGPIFWIALGVFLLYRSNQKKQDEEDKNKWSNQ